MILLLLAVKKTYQAVGNVQEFITDLSEIPIFFLLNHLSTFLISISLDRDKFEISIHSMDVLPKLFLLQKTFHKHDQIEHVLVPPQVTLIKETFYIYLNRTDSRHRQKSLQ